MPNLGGWEIVAIVLLIFVLFGARKLPEAARGLGRSLRIFKAEIKDPNDEEGRDTTAELPPAANQQTIAPTPVAPPAPVAQPVVQQPVAPVQATEQVPVAQPVQQPVQQSTTDR